MKVLQTPLFRHSWLAIDSWTFVVLALVEAVFASPLILLGIAMGRR